MTAVIELGETWTLPEEPDQVRPPGSRLPWIMLALLLLTALDGGAVPRYRMVSLFAVPIEVGSTHTVAGDTLYLARPAGITAYRLPDGTRRWTALTAHRVGAMVAVSPAGVVLAQLDGDRDTSGVLALDARDGRVLWSDGRARLLGALPGSGRALLLHVDEVRAVDTPTGRTIWERPRGLGLGWAMPDMDPTQNA